MGDTDNSTDPQLTAEQIPDAQATDVPTLQGYLRLKERTGCQIKDIELFDPSGANVNVLEYISTLDVLSLPPIEADEITADAQLAQLLQTRTSIAYSVLKIGGNQTKVLLCRAATSTAPAAPPTAPTSLSWDIDPSRRSWSSMLLAMVTNAKTSLEKGTPEQFIAGYNGLSDDLKVKYWAELIIAISKYECGWDASQYYTESDGSNSIGLLQISMSDQKGYKVSPKITDESQLTDPLINIQWGVTILATLVAKDGVVASSDGGKYLGGAKYWSTLRVGNMQGQTATLPAIIEYTKNQLNL